MLNVGSSFCWEKSSFYPPQAVPLFCLGDSVSFTFPEGFSNRTCLATLPFLLESFLSVDCSPAGMDDFLVSCSPLPLNLRSQTKDEEPSTAARLDETLSHRGTSFPVPWTMFPRFLVVVQGLKFSFQSACMSSFTRFPSIHCHFSIRMERLHPSGVVTCGGIPSVRFWSPEPCVFLLVLPETPYRRVSGWFSDNLSVLPYLAKEGGTLVSPSAEAW